MTEEQLIHIPLTSCNIVDDCSSGPSTKDVRKFSSIFDPYPPHVCTRLQFKDPSLKRTSANQEFDPLLPLTFNFLKD